MASQVEPEDGLRGAAAIDAELGSDPRRAGGCVQVGPTDDDACAALLPAVCHISYELVFLL